MQRLFAVESNNPLAGATRKSHYQLFEVKQYAEREREKNYAVYGFNQ